MNPKTTAINLSPDTFAESCDKLIAERIRIKKEKDNKIVNTTFESIKKSIKEFVKNCPLNVKEEVTNYLYDDGLKYTNDHLLVIVEGIKALGFEVRNRYVNSIQSLELNSKHLKILLDFEPNYYKMIFITKL